MCRSFQSFNIPSPTGDPRAFDRRPYRRGGFRPWLAGMENLNHKCQIFPTEYKCYIFLTWGCLKVNNSLSQANDCEEKGKGQ